MQRKCDDFLQSYKEYTLDHESPDQFHMWIASSIIAGALRRKVWLDRGAYRLYPNMYIFIVAESASSRKTAAMGIGLNILRGLFDIDILYERTSPEGLIDRMSKMHPDIRDVVGPGGISMDGSIFISADEVSNLFGKSAYVLDLITILTSSYTCGTIVEFTTRNKGISKVYNPCPNMLAGTTPQQMSEVFPSLTLFNGFLGRTVLVAGKRRKRKATPIMYDDLKGKLTEDLILINNLEGEFKFTKEADKAFTHWYEKELPDDPPIGILPSFYERLHDHVLKMAMILSVSRKDDLIIDIEDFRQSVNILDFTMNKSSDVFSYVGATQESTITDLLYDAIRGSFPESISQNALINRFYRRFKSMEDFESSLNMLIKTNKVKTFANATGVHYIMKSK